MKKLILLLVLFFAFGFLYSQPQKISYQAIVRDGNGNVLQNQNVVLQLDILQGSATGSVVYSETHNVTTNQYGLVNVFIGDGIVNQGVFSDIDWSQGPYFLKTYVDAGSGIEELGTQELVSVPYSLYSKNAMHADSISVVGNTGEIQFNNNGVLDASPNLYWDVTKERLGIGTNTPQGRLVIQQDPLAPDSLPLFEVKDKEGEPVFVVYRDSVHIYLPIDSNKAIGSLGKFAVSGRVTTKGVSKPYLYVTPDSTRIYFEKDNSKAIGSLGGFAVSGRVTTKSGESPYFYVTPDSTRIYFDEDNSKAIGSLGGFAVSGRVTTKGAGNDYFAVSPSDSVAIINPSQPRVYWYPNKEAFLTGRVLIESPDSVGMNSFVTGFESKAIGNYSQAMGYRVVARRINSTAIGFHSIAAGVSSYAFGAEVFAGDTSAFAFGHKSAALAKGSFVFGEGDTAIAASSMALGYNNKATGVSSLALGANSKATNLLSVSMGFHTFSGGISSVAMGDSTQALGDNSLALGTATEASGISSTAMGFGTKATGGGAVAMGHMSIASGFHSIAFGDSTLAIGTDATSMGYHTIASGDFSTAMGNYTQAIGPSSFSSGAESVASGEASIAMGRNTQATDTASISMGESTQATGKASIAMGENTQASGEASISMGASTRADGFVSLSMGLMSTASDTSSIAIGINTFAEGIASVALGVGTHTTSRGSFVFGSFNETWAPVNSTNLTDDLFVIANGTDPFHPHNAFTVLKSGFVGINTNTPDKLLTVNGDARVTGDIYYGAIGSISTYTKPDFVFKPDYEKDFGIDYIERFIKKHGHLPWVTAAKEEKNGINMTRMSFQTLEAVENLQLQIIDLNKKLESKDSEIDMLRKENKELRKRIERIEKILKNKK